MFVVILTYRGDISSIDPHIDAHMNWLERYYEAGIFLFSGRRQPRIGGVIIAHDVDRYRLDDILQEDPFKIHAIADYQVIEFKATRTHADLNDFIENNN